MDWKLIIADLIAVGQTQTDIAAFCGCGQTTVSELGRGLIKSPSWAIGQKLIALHKREMRKQPKAIQPA